MPKVPTHKQSKKMQKFESDLLTSEMRTQDNKFKADIEEVTFKQCAERYKAYLKENGLLGFQYFVEASDLV